jgi:hypothetical protein
MIKLGADSKSNPMEGVDHLSIEADEDEAAFSFRR